MSIYITADDIRLTTLILEETTPFVQGQHMEADILFRKSIEIFESAFGPGHLALGDALANRAITLVHLVRE